MRDINGTLYCNDGDWVESRSALVEHMDGRLEIIFWDALLAEHSARQVQPVQLLALNS
jgi:hypothetical protein